MKLTSVTKLLFLITACAGIASTARAAIISETYVESRSGGKNFAAYIDSGVFPNAWSNSTAKSTASGLTAGIGSRFNSNSATGGAAAYFEVSPTLPTAGATYDVYVTVTSTAGAAVNSTLTVTGGTGLPATTTAFSLPANDWHLVGQLKLNTGVTTPIIRFDETANDNRFYADAVRFSEVTVPEPASCLLAMCGCLGGLSLIRRRTA